MFDQSTQFRHILPFVRTSEHHNLRTIPLVQLIRNSRE